MAGSAELVDLAYVGASKKPTKAMEFSPHHGILEILGVMGFLEVKPEIFRSFLEKFRKDF